MDTYTKPGKQVQTLKADLNKDRATRLEGSFGNEKNHYGLEKVKARKQNTEITWIILMSLLLMQCIKKRQVRQQDQSPPATHLKAT